MRLPGSGCRRAAATVLGEIKAEEAVGPLIELLQGEHPSVHRAAAEALGKIKAGEAAGPLIERLQDEDAGMRRVAAWVLSMIGYNPPLPPPRLPHDRQSGHEGN